MNNSSPKIISQIEVEKRIKQAEMQGIDADFSNETIKELNLSERIIKCGINFKNTIFLGNLYFGKSSIMGTVIFENAIIGGVLYLGELKISEDFIASKISAKNSLNMVMATIEGNVNLSKARVQGFLSLNKTSVKGWLSLKETRVTDLKTPTGIIRGDLFLQRVVVEKYVDIEGSYVSGLADLEGISIREDLNFSNSKIEEIFLMKESYIGGEKILEGLESKERIISI